MSFVNWLRTVITSWPMRRPIPYLKATAPVPFIAGICGTSICPGSIPPFFEYHKGRGSSGIDTLLAGQVRVVQSDGFAVYDEFDTLPESCTCTVGHMSGASLWKRKGMTLPEQGMHLNK